MEGRLALIIVAQASGLVFLTALAVNNYIQIQNHQEINRELVRSQVIEQISQIQNGLNRSKRHIYVNGEDTVIHNNNDPDSESAVDISDVVNKAVEVKLSATVPEEVNAALSTTVPEAVNAAVSFAIRQADITTKDSGTVYTRWGRQVCPGNTTLLYSGEAAGSFYNHYGGGANLQCLPISGLEYLKYSDSINTEAWIYGVEYQVNNVAGDNSLLTNGNLHNTNAPCAACYATGRNAKIMIPGRISCPDSNWTVEYQGFLMSGHFNHKGRQEFICVDKDAEGIIGSSTNNNGALLYHVQAVCRADSGDSGRLRSCPPFVHGRELSCVVCTK